MHIIQRKCDLSCYNLQSFLSPLSQSIFSFVFSLSDLEDFIQVAKVGLSKSVAEGDYSGLVEVMGHLLAVKERQSSTDEMFEPLQQTIDLLKTYEQELPDVVYKQLEVISTGLVCFA